MEDLYQRATVRLYEKRAEAGRKLAYQARLVADGHRQTGKSLKVVAFPQGGERVPSIRVAGKWLERLGFKLGDEVILRANQGHITITSKEASDHGSSVV